MYAIRSYYVQDHPLRHPVIGGDLGGGAIAHVVVVGPYGVIRAEEVDDQGDMEPIIIGANSNIQDGVVIHSKSGAPVTIGEFSSIAHRSIVHGPCVVGDRVFVITSYSIHYTKLYDEGSGAGGG